MMLWLVASGYLVFQGFYTRAVAVSVRSVSIPAVAALTSIQQERRLSISYLAQPSGDLRKLVDQRKLADERLSTMRAATDSALANAPESIVLRWQALAGFLDQLPSQRSTIDSRSTNQQDVYEFYNGLLDAATTLFDTQARVVPDVTSTQGGIAAVEAFRATDLMSRAGSRIDGALASRTFGQQVHLEFVNLVGAYHASLTNIAPHLQPDARMRYETLTASDPWRELVAAENAIITAGARQNGIPRGLSVTQARWETLTRQVSDKLIDLTVTQADIVSAQALQTGNNQLLTASLASLIALSIAAAAILWALRQSREIPVRLAKLGEDAAAVVDQRLPAMMERLRRREKVDLAMEFPFQDYGSDEIGQMAGVINRSLQAAAAAAIDEAKTRAAGMAMLMGVARRPQRPLQHGMKVIEGLQNRTGDEQLLAELFDVNHQFAQTRRFLENLLILAGGQIGRRFQNPVPVRRVLLAAFAETQNYQRIVLRSAPDVAIVGQAVAGTIHLLSELLDNALAFSPPAATVSVTCTQAAHGVAVEIEDAGVGLRPDVMEHANELLATAPTPDVTALKDGAQVGLYVVAELANRNGIQVTLRTSAYDGVLAIVLLPDRVIAGDAAAERPESGGQPPVTPSPVQQPGGGAMHHEMRPAAALPAAAIATLPNGAAPAASGSYSGEVRVSERTGSMMGDHQTTGRAAIPRQPESSVAGAFGGGPPSSQAAARPPLPHRQPQQHLAPELRDDLSSTGTTAAAVSVRSPEDARDRLSRYQQAWAAGKAAGIPDSTKDNQGRKA
ncbi:nitrate- and nitrite sensing domain-containing protein [Micromonospora sp. SL1-18]|uniref:sensor histidine kinase n=1 Tax=Micromonospora sp. SL1-18 TaxID=3399128 RepID=UPI003A4D458C